MKSHKSPSVGGLWTIVLAAGGSSRLGRPKQLERYRGAPLLEHAARLAGRVTGANVVVVLGAARLRLRAALRRGRSRPARIVVNPRWRGGLAGSLASGIDALPRAARAALILLTDQPHIGAQDLGRLVGRWRRRQSVAVAAHYGGRCGVPAILPRRLFRQLRALEGDVGARHLLRDLPRLECVWMPSAELDVDTEADAIRLREPARR